AQRFFDHGAHAAFVNIAHGVNLDTGLANVFLLAAIDVAYAHQHAVLRLDLGRETVNVGQVRRAQAHDGSQRHAVHVAAGGSLRRVDVGMRVNPDQPDLLFLHAALFAIELRHTGHRTRSHRVVAAKDQRYFPAFQRLVHGLRMFGAGGGNFFQILGTRIAFLLLLRNSHGDIAAVFHYVSQSFQPRFQAGHAHG